MSVKIDGIYNNVQVHFRLPRKPTEEEIPKIEAAVKWPMSGFVHVNIFANRIILTSSQPPENGEKYAKTAQKRIEEVFSNGME